MNYINFLLIFISFFATFFVRKSLKKQGLFDLPTERGMHAYETLRGGGLAVVACLILLIFYHFLINSLENAIAIPLIIALLIIGLLGLYDDLKSLSLQFRLIVHFIVASFLVFVLQENIKSIDLYPLPIIGFFKDIFFILFIVWLINLYNFMDGINGIASTQAICFFTSIAILSIFISELSHEIYLGYSAIFFGFLLWNFPKARIFLGDAGSGSIGVFIAVNSIYLSSFNSNVFWICLILMSIFIVDTTFTLLVRVLQKQSFRQAHNSHAYQKLALVLGSHTPVTLTTVFINMMIILPLVAVFLTLQWDLFYLMLIIYMFLTVLAFYLKAGRAQ